MRRGARSGGAVRWRQRLRRFERSGLTVVEFCEREGVSPASFYQWRRKLAQGERRSRQAPAAVSCGAEASAAPAFQAVVVRPVLLPLVVELPGGVRIEVPADNLELVRAVIGELAAARDHQPAGEAAC